MPPLDPPDTENTAPRTTGVPRALLLFGALAIAGAVTYATPALEPLRPWTDGSAVPFTRFLEFRPPVRETIGRIRERQRARFATVQGGSAGTAVSLYRLFYDAFPGGGEVSLSVDGAAPRFVSTAAATLEDRVEDLPVADGPHVLEVHAGRGDLRLFGVVSERDRPGVVVDGLMLVGAFTRVLLHWDADHWTRQLELREPDLLVFWLGGNDSVSHTWGFDHDRYVADYVEVLRRARRGSRPVACLVMSVTDSAEEHNGVIESRRRVPRVVAAQHEAARQAGCALFRYPCRHGRTGCSASMVPGAPEAPHGGLSASDAPGCPRAREPALQGPPARVRRLVGRAR